jgi:hypothetical protein
LQTLEEHSDPVDEILAGREAGTVRTVDLANAGIRRAHGTLRLSCSGIGSAIWPTEKIFTESDDEEREQDQAPCREKQPSGVEQVSSIAEHIVLSSSLVFF